MTILCRWGFVSLSTKMMPAWGKEWFPYVRVHAPQYLGGSFLVLIAVLAELSIPKVIGRLLDQYPFMDAWQVMRFFGLALGLRAIGVAGGRWLFARQGLGGLLWLRSQQSNEIFREGSCSSGANPGEWVQRLGGDSRGAAFFFGTNWLIGTNLGFSLLFTFLGLVSLAPAPALVVTLFWPFLFYFLYRYTQRERAALSDNRTAMGEFSSSLAHSLRWLRHLKLLDGAERSTGELAALSNGVLLKGWNARFLALKGEFAGFLVSSLLSAVALVWLVNEAQAGRISMGNLVAFLTYLTLGTGTVAQVPGYLSAIRWARVCLGHLEVAVATEPGIVTPPPTDPSVVLACDEFSLPDWDQPLTLSLTRGESLAVHGESGSGKTTLLRAWCGAPVRHTGALKFAGGKRSILADKRAVYVPQWPIVFSGTIRENLALGLEISEKEIWESLSRVELVEEFRASERGLDTVLGEQGAGLSTGQKQRLALARALLRKPSLLVLDDCLSGVDHGRGERIMESLHKQFHGCTLVISGQRDWWLAACSRQVTLPSLRAGALQ